MRFLLSYRDDGGTIQERYSGDDYEILTPFIQSAGSGHPVSGVVAITNPDDRAFFTSLRGPLAVTIERVETDELIPE